MSTTAASVPQLLTAEEVAKVLRLSRAQVYALKQEIGCVRFGRVVRFRADVLSAYIAQHSEGAAISIGKIDLKTL